MIAGEVEDYKAQLEQLERAYKQQAGELSEANDRVNELSAQNSSLNAHKKRLETTVQQMQSDLDAQVSCDLLRILIQRSLAECVPRVE